MRPRTDRVELEKYHEGLIVCTACIAGEVPRNIIAGNMKRQRRLSNGINVYSEMILFGIATS